MKKKNKPLRRIAAVAALSVLFCVGTVATTKLSEPDIPLLSAFASTNSGVSNVSSSDFMVSAVGISGVKASAENFYVGEEYQLEPILLGGAKPEDVQWTSKYNSIATVDANGKIKCHKIGNTTIIAKLPNGEYTRFYIKVVNKITSIEFANKDQYVLIGKNIALNPTITPKGSGDSITYTVSDSDIAEALPNGMIKANKKGDTVVFAESGSGVPAEVNLHCVEPASEVKITSDKNYVYVDEQLQLNAVISPETSNDQVKWTTSNRSVATVSSNGVVNALKKGTVKITATSMSGKKYTKTIYAVKKATGLKFAKNYAKVYTTGKGYTNKLTVYPSGCGDHITYTSSDESIATVNSSGKVTAVGAGNVTITATSGSGVSVSYDVYCVIGATGVKYSAPKKKIYIDETLQLTPTIIPLESNDTLTWSSSNSRILSVDQNGLVTPHNRGGAYITLKASSGKYYRAMINVVLPATEISYKKSMISVVRGKTATNTITVLPKGCGDAIYYSSEDTSIATVDENGKVTGVTVGQTVINAVSGSGMTASYTVDVIPPVLTKISLPNRSTVKAGNSIVLKAAVTPSTGIDENHRLSWSSSDTKIAEVEWISDTEARVYGISNGWTYITAKAPSGKAKYSAIVSVAKTPDIEKIVLNKYELDMEMGGDSFKLEMEVIPPESLTERRYIKTYSKDTSIAKIDPDGKITAVGVGSTSIVCEASDGTMGTRLDINVYPAAQPAKSITVSAAQKTIFSSEVLTLTAAPNPAESVNPLKALKWSSADESIAAVSSSGLLTAEVTGISKGKTKITVETYNGVKATYDVTVNIKEPAPTSVEVSEKSINVPVNPKGKRQVKAEVYPKNAADTNVHWLSDNPEIAAVTLDGYVTGLKKGKATIKAYACNKLCDEMTINVVQGGLVYLSPSRQADNPYYCGNTTEYEQMYKVAAAARMYLEAAGYDVYTAPYELKIRGRDYQAAELNAACYVAIHSNAAGAHRGTVAFYYTQLESSKTICEAVYNKVAALTPNKDEGIKANDNYIETHCPGELGIPSTLLEVDYHSNKGGATWIMKNIDPLGKAIAEGIIEWMEARPEK